MGLKEQPDRRQAEMTSNADRFTCVCYFLGFERTVCVAVHILCESDVNMTKAHRFIRVNACVHKGLMCEKWISIILCLVFQINSKYRQIHKYKISSSVNVVCVCHVATH